MDRTTKLVGALGGLASASAEEWSVLEGRV